MACMHILEFIAMNNSRIILQASWREYGKFSELYTLRPIYSTVPSMNKSGDGIASNKRRGVLRGQG